MFITQRPLFQAIVPLVSLRTTCPSLKGEYRYIEKMSRCTVYASCTILTFNMDQCTRLCEATKTVYLQKNSVRFIRDNVYTQFSFT